MSIKKQDFFSISVRVSTGFMLLFLLLFIIKFTAPIYFWDEWDVIKSTNILDFWKAHNEHRIFLTKLIYYCLSSWPIRPQIMMCLSATLVCILLLGLTENWLKYLVQPLKLPPIEQIIVATTLSLFFLSLCQYENFFWGMQICWFLSEAGFLLALIGTHRQKHLVFLLGFLLIYLSLASWVVVVPIILLQKYLLWREQTSPGDKSKYARQFFVYLGFFGLMTILFFNNYDHLEQTRNIQIGQFFMMPVLFLRILGSPFALLGKNFAIIAALAFVLLTLVLVRMRKLEVRTLEFSIIFFGLLYSLLVAFGRGKNWHLDNSVGIRYSTLVIPSWMALFLSLLKASPKKAWYMIVALICLDISFSFPKALRTSLEEQAFRFEGAHCLAQELKQHLPTEAQETCLKKLYPDASYVETARQFGSNQPDFLPW